MSNLFLVCTLILLFQTPGVEVIEQSVESRFPDQLDFFLQVRSDDAQVVDADLLLWLGWEETPIYIPAEPFSPGQEVEIEALFPTVNETIPPFIEVAYQWKITLSNGEVVSLDTVQTEYADATHPWQRLEDEHVILFWYDHSQEFGQTIFEAAQEAYEHVSRITGTSTDRPIRVVIYNDQESFCGFYAPRTCQDWVGGQTFSGITVQWGESLDWFAVRVIPHELAHVFYGEIMRDMWMPIPTWFNEGIAIYNEPRDHYQEMIMVANAAEQGELEPLAVMTRGGGVAHGEVSLWYAVAYSLVAYMADTYGEETLGELILTVADNVPFEDALMETMGLDMAQMEIEWRAWLGYPIEEVPTPIPFPTMVEIPLQATPSGGMPTATPVPPASPTPSPTPAPPAPGLPCPAVVMVVVGGVLGYWVTR